MSWGDVIVLTLGLGAYPIAALGVALTGPHSPAERADYERFKAERRK